MHTATKTPFFISCASALIIAASQLPSIALGRPPGEVGRVRVTHVDLDPATDAAARRVLTRLSEAALEACGASPFSLKEVQDAIRSASCWHDSLSQVIARIDSPRLTTVFEEQIERQRHAA